MLDTVFKHQIYYDATIAALYLLMILILLRGLVIRSYFLVLSSIFCACMIFYGYYQQPFADDTLHQKYEDQCLFLSYSTGKSNGRQRIHNTPMINNHIPLYEMSKLDREQVDKSRLEIFLTASGLKIAPEQVESAVIQPCDEKKEKP